MVSDEKQRVLYYLWSQVMVAVRFMTGPQAPYRIGSDDVSMQHATPDDIYGWVDDCEDRLGFDVSNVRAAVTDYLVVRDGEAGGCEPHEVDAVLSQALWEMGGGKRHAAGGR